MTRGRTGSGQCPKKTESENDKLLQEIYWIAAKGVMSMDYPKALEKILILTDKFSLMKETK
jgi:hypothetical protein